MYSAACKNLTMHSYWMHTVLLFPQESLNQGTGQEGT
jgi:hypothetical protein